MSNRPEMSTSQADDRVSGTNNTLRFGITPANPARPPRTSYTYHAGNCASAVNAHRTYACILPHNG